MKKKRPTQRAVAEAAQVSQSLVSVVLNGSRRVEVAAETRDRILRVAREMGYVRSSASGDGFQRSDPRILAYIRPVVTRTGHSEHWIYDSYTEFYNRLQAELMEHAYKAGYTLIVRPYSEPMELTHWLLESGASGVFWHARDDKLLRWIAERYPVVEINRRSLPNSDGVAVDQEAIIALAMDYLRSKGHEKVAFLPTPPLDDKLFGLRIRAYLEYVKEAGLPCWEQFLTDGEDRLESFGDWYLAQQTGGRVDLPTAVIGNDHRILLIMKKLRAGGVRIPEDLSLLGIDNISACEYADPPLTSIDSPLRWMAHQAVDVMMSRLEDMTLPYRKVTIATRLIERKSIAAVGPQPDSLSAL